MEVALCAKPSGPLAERALFVFATAALVVGTGFVVAGLQAGADPQGGRSRGATGLLIVGGAIFGVVALALLGYLLWRAARDVARCARRGTAPAALV